MKRVIHPRVFARRHIRSLFGAIAVVLLSLAPAAQAATLTHKYTFETDYSDSEGSLPIVPVVSMISNPGGRHILGNYDPSKPNNGLTLTNGLSDTSDYSIVLVFEFDAPSEGTNTFKKIIDFQGLTTDEGLYTSQYTLYFYGATSPSGTPLTPEEDAHLVLTRDSSTKLVTFYLDGVEQGSFTDNSELAIPSGNVLTFFEDDDTTRNTYPEYHSGSVDDIEIYNGALSPTDVRSLYNAWAGIENTAPVANDDSYLMRANTVFSSSPDSVLDNDNDVNGDELTAVLGTDAANGTLTLSSDGTFTYTPNTDFCGEDSFTYKANDGAADSNEATVTIEVNCPPVIVLSEGEADLGSQTVQYSDEVYLSIQVEDPDDSSTELLVSGTPTASTGSLGLTKDGCYQLPPDYSVSRCTFRYTGQVLDPGYETHTITFTPKDSVGKGTPATFKLTINAEDAEVTLASDNDISAEVQTPGVDDAEFSLFFAAWEFDESGCMGCDANKPGDLNNMRGFMELQPVGPGSTVKVACSFIDPLPAGSPNLSYDEEALFQCDFYDVPVNTYTVAAEVWGENYFAGTFEDQSKDVYYYGSEEDVFTVFDPSLGFTSGGGWLYWPETSVPEDACLEYDSQEPFDCLVPDPCAGYPGDKTNFGFNLKYNKKKNSAKGSLLLMRHTVDENCEDAGSYRLKSNAIEAMSLGDDQDANGAFGWAAASGKAVYREPDLIDEGNYTFLMYVEDHGEQGCGQDPADVFRIVVRDKDGNDVDDLSVDLKGDEGGDGGQIECGNILVPHKTGKKGGGDGGGGPKEPNPKKPPKG
ncbi:MAG: Ig-like domain-containing protein [Xanthomonadales bacterium]|nr:Ig-like domain-containing protein [Xanthomonadales bacterium]